MDGLPKVCPHCGYEPAARDDTVIHMPAFVSAKTKSIDASARQYFDGSETRARLAAEVAGVPEAEMSSLKVLDFDTTAREGEAVVKPVTNDVTKHMDNTGFGGFGAVTPQQAQNLAAQAHVGDEPHAGARAQQYIQRKFFGLPSA